MRTRSGATLGGWRPTEQTESASYDAGEDESDFDSEVATGEVSVERSIPSPEERKRGAAPMTKTVVLGKAPASPPVNQPAPSGPQAIQPPAKPAPEPMRPIQPPIQQRAKKVNNGLMVLIAMIIAAIAALLWWLFG